MVNKRIEKYAVFSKDFRGLPDGWHNILACNFLVGENSTGKSSFLQLLQLIDAREHMVFFDICGVIEGLDTAYDICSRISGKNETTIGFLIKERESEAQKEKLQFLGRLATYKKVDEKMQLVRLTMLAGDRLFRLKRSKSRISYRFDYAFYKNSISHAENAKDLEKRHFQTGERFTKFEEFDWAEVPDIHAWLRTISTAVFSSKRSKDDQLLQSYSPLRSLHHGPMRAKTRRLYHGIRTEFSSTGEHVPYLLRDALKSNSKLSASIEKFGRLSGLFDRISVTSVKTAIKDKPFALQIEKSGSVFYVDELGYGVGQVLPIISDIALTDGAHAFLIQQPELHLHPKAQAALGDIFQSATEEGGAFVIETHSDFLIDRFRINNKKAGSSPRAQIIYFEKDDTGSNVSHEIELFSDGTMSAPPEGYRSFFLNESVEKFENL